MGKFFGKLQVQPTKTGENMQQYVGAAYCMESLQGNLSLTRSQWLILSNKWQFFQCLMALLVLNP